MMENKKSHQSQAQEICLLIFIPHQAKMLTCTLAPGEDAERVAALKGMWSASARYHGSKVAHHPHYPAPHSPTLGSQNVSPSSTALATPHSSSDCPLFPAEAGAKRDCTNCAWQKVPGRL